MSRTFADLFKDALRLSQKEQLKLARTILENNEALRNDVDDVWEAEIDRRIQTIDSGVAQGRPFADVVRDIDRQLSR